MHQVPQWIRKHCQLRLQGAWAKLNTLKQLLLFLVLTLKQLLSSSCRYPNQEIKGTDHDDKTWSVFISGKWRLIFKHCRKLKKNPKSLHHCLAQCTGTLGSELQRIMNNIDVTDDGSDCDIDALPNVNCGLMILPKIIIEQIHWIFVSHSICFSLFVFALLSLSLSAYHTDSFSLSV